MSRIRTTISSLVSGTLLVLGCLSATSLHAQDKLKTHPRYEQFQKFSRQLQGAWKSGALSVGWTDGGKAFEYMQDGKRWRFDIEKLEKTEAKTTKDSAPIVSGGRQPRGRSGFPGRGRQFGTAVSPNGALKAVCKDRNVWLADATGALEKQITTDGSEAGRIKNGVASWVYGEELFQPTAMWWSPDSKKLAYYRFDESQVKDYYLALSQLKLQTTVGAEPYPKAGTPNPIVELFIYDTETKISTKVDVRDGAPFSDSVVGHYVYHVDWAPDGSVLLFNRTNRLQNIMELASADPSTGKCKAIVHEEWLPSWVENTPTLRFLKDGKRFIWSSERNGYKNYFLYDLSGKLISQITKNEFDSGSIERVDEEANVLDYLAHDGDNPMKLQLHRASLDGSSDKRLTDPAFNHSVSIAPDGKHFIDIAQTHDSPPATKLFDAEGKKLADLAESDVSGLDKLGAKHAEMFTFKAADGKTDLYGMLQFPSDFDSKKTYPLLISVYAGPATNGAREAFAREQRSPSWDSWWLLWIREARREEARRSSTRSISGSARLRSTIRPLESGISARGLTSTRLASEFLALRTEARRPRRA